MQLPEHCRRADADTQEEGDGFETAQRAPSSWHCALILCKAASEVTIVARGCHAPKGNCDNAFTKWDSSFRFLIMFLYLTTGRAGLQSWRSPSNAADPPRYDPCAIGLHGRCSFIYQSVNQSFVNPFSVLRQSSEPILCALSGYLRNRTWWNESPLVPSLIIRILHIDESPVTAPRTHGARRRVAHCDGLSFSISVHQCLGLRTWVAIGCS